eukprot:13014-Heterococcus_DN1.PRE.1
MTVFKAAVASAAVIKLACDCGLRVDSSRLQFIAGRWGDIATLTAAFEYAMPQSPYVCDGAARGGCLAELKWLVRDQGFQVHDIYGVSAAESGSVPVLDFLKQCGISFTVDTAYSAAAAGHQHTIQYLHAEACPIDQSVYFAAARPGHVHVLQSLRELDCAWDSAQLCRQAASNGYVPVLQWAKQQGAVFTEDTMHCAAAQGHTAVCEYLLAEQCPCSETACIAAALRCQLDTLQLLIEHGCPFAADTLYAMAARGGHVSVLNYLQKIGLTASSLALMGSLIIAGSLSHLAAAQWLRAQGVEWPLILSMPVEDSESNEMKLWEGAVLEWARAEGCTSPLE